MIKLTKEAWNYRY